jgi:hypothetical protein
VRPDAYGKLQFDKWTKEIDYFLVNHVAPSLTNAECKLLYRERGLIVGIVAD